MYVVSGFVQWRWKWGAEGAVAPPDINHLNPSIDFVGKASTENSRPTSPQSDALRRIVSLSISCFQQKIPSIEP